MARNLSIRLSLEDRDVVIRGLQSLGTEGQQALRKIETASGPASRGMTAFRAAANDAQSSAAAYSSRLGPLGAGLSKLGPIGIAAAAGIGAITLAVGAGLRQWAEAERVQLRLEAVLRATGNAAGVTAKQIEEFADKLAKNSLFDDEQIKEAAAALATFQSVAGPAFTKTIESAADLSAVFGGDLKTNTETLGRVLESIAAKDVEGLDRAFKFLSPTVRQNVKDMAEAGRTAEAQAALFDALSKSVGGAAAGEASGLYGSTVSASKAWDEFLESLGQTVEQSGIVAGALDLITSALDALRETASPQQLREKRLAEIDAELQSGFIRGPRGIGPGQRTDSNPGRRAELEAEAQSIRIITAEETKRESARQAAARQAQADRQAALDLLRQEQKERDEADKAGKAAAVTAKQRAKVEDDARQALLGQIEALKEEQAQLLLTERERFIRVESLKAEAEIKKGLIEDGAKYLEQVRAEAGALFDATAAAEARKQAESDLTKEVGRLSSERARLAQKEADAWRRPFETLADEIGGIFQTLFDGLAGGAGLSFGSIGRSLLGAVGGLFGGGASIGSLFGGGVSLAGGQSGAGGLLSNVGQFLFGTSAADASKAGSVTAAEYALAGGGAQPGLFGTSSSTLAAGFGSLIQAGIGAAVSLASGGNKGQAIGSLVGTAAGAVIGSIIPGIGTVLGATIGGLIGGIGGGLLGGGGKPKAAAYIGLDAAGLARGAGAAAKNKGSTTGVLSPRDAAVEGINSALDFLGATFKSADIGYESPALLGGIGQVKEGYYATVGGVRKGFGAGQQGATKAADFFAAQSIVQAAKRDLLAGLDSRLQALIGASGAQNLEDLTTAIGLGRLAYDLPEVSKSSVAFNKSLTELIQQFEKSRQKAVELGLTVDDKLSARFDDAKKGLEEQYFGEFKNFERQLLLGENSTLSPEQQLGEAKSKFDEIVRRARQGDDGARGQFVGAAETYLGLARQQYASSGQYASIFNDVLALTREFGSPPSASIDFDVSPVVSAVDNQTAQTLIKQNELIAEFKNLREEMRRDRAERAASGNGRATAGTRGL